MRENLDLYLALKSCCILFLKFSISLIRFDRGLFDLKISSCGKFKRPSAYILVEVENEQSVSTYDFLMKF